MRLIEIYKCLCDETRLRILNLLAASPLCVCYLQQILGKSQVVISQHLAYLRVRKMVAARRHRHWMVYSLPSACPEPLRVHLRCLQEAGATEPVFRRDRKNLEKLMGSQTIQMLLDDECCARIPAKAAPARRSRKGKGAA